MASKAPPSEIPEDLNNGKGIPTAVVAALFGYSTASNLRGAVLSGHFPRHDRVENVERRAFNRTRRVVVNVWNYATLVAEADRRRKCLAAGISFSKNPTTLEGEKP